MESTPRCGSPERRSQAMRPGADYLDRVAAERLAAINSDKVAVNIAGSIRYEENREIGDVLDLAPPLEW